MNEFFFDDQATPWDLALDALAPGQTMKATRFLTLVETMEDGSPEEAALELEQRQIALDISDLPVLPGNPETEGRLHLEQKLYGTGEWKTTLESHDPLYRFLEELEGAGPRGSVEALARRCAQGDENAMEELTRAYLPKVYAWAGAYLGKGVLLSDLLQEGSLGLWEAVLCYRGGDLEGHCHWWVSQAMARAVTLQALENGVGGYLVRQVQALGRADQTLLTRLGRSPTLAELAQELNLNLEQTMALTKLLREIRAQSKRQEPKADEDQEKAVEDTAYFQTRQRIDSLMSALTRREQELLNLRYGLTGKPPMTAPEVARVLGCTAQEVVEAETAALAKMRP